MVEYPHSHSPHSAIGLLSGRVLTVRDAKESQQKGRWMHLRQARHRCLKLAQRTAVGG
jgi:hypothetical protein